MQAIHRQERIYMGILSLNNNLIYYTIEKEGDIKKTKQKDKTKKSNKENPK